MSRDPKLSLCQRQKLQQKLQQMLRERQKPKPRQLLHLRRRRRKNHQLPQLPVDQLPQKRKLGETVKRFEFSIHLLFKRDCYQWTIETVFCLGVLFLQSAFRLWFQKPSIGTPFCVAKNFGETLQVEGQFPWFDWRQQTWDGVTAVEKMIWCFLPFSWTAVSISNLGKANVGTCLMKLDEVYPPLRGVYIVKLYYNTLLI